MRKHLIAVAAAATLAAPLLVTSTAEAAVPPRLHVDFEGEPTGNKPNGYATGAAPDVRFYDTMGADLNVLDYGNQSNGQALAVNGDDASALEIRLANPTTSLKLSFGNDDPGFSDPTDQAMLTAYRGATQVGQSLKNLNANDDMDQSIRVSGALFNRVVFQYVDAAENPINLIEIVDDLDIAPLCTVLGTPGNDLLVGTPGPDVICADDGVDTVRALGGDDLIYAGKGRDTVYSGSGRDKANGGGGKDRLFGQQHRDRLHGGKKRDFCHGGPGWDVGISCEVRRAIP